MKTILKIFICLFFCCSLTSGYAQYVDYAYHKESLEDLGFDYQPVNPLVIDRLFADDAPADPLYCPVIFQDTTK